ncbi:MAG: indolepyruvate ferredoxin oxidoreductase subunit alpha [Candidatus Hydrothermarchaeota archaeon]|nr:MAG: indolepyruvate ferredoxin oxidoreductase subunit alpha [Candidatus Hydrothermarchaeota archaeon]
MHSVLASPGEKVLLLGNEAVARGALETGVSFAVGYPGTPSTEIIETLVTASKYYDIYVEWFVNEKVALEGAIGASMCGARSMAVMKHVGVNVAADPLMSLGYSGVEGGLVIVTADDPSAHSSQNEQDNRLYGLHSYIPVLEPCCPQEAKDIVSLAYSVSEKYSTAVFLRLTTRISHVRGNVTLGEICLPRKGKEFSRKYERWVLLPVNSRRLHQEAIERIDNISKQSFFEGFDLIEVGNIDKVILTSGVAYTYVKEAIKRLNVEKIPTIIKTIMPYPLSKYIAEQAFRYGKEGILVVEELEPVIETQLKIYADDLNYESTIIGKKYVPRILELNVDKVSNCIAKFLNIKYKEPSTLTYECLPPRPPTLCPGCGHRSTYYAIKIASMKSKADIVYPGDIGCYTLGYFPPLNLVDISYAMGSGLGIGCGIAKSSDHVVIATIGDSTFYHAGIPALINAVYNNIGIILVVMDNMITAMTGHQPHPGTGFNAKATVRKRILIEDIAKSVGVEFLEVIDAYNVSKLIEKIEEAISYVQKESKPAVIIARKRCALMDVREKMKRKERIKKYQVIENKCIGCKICINMFGCPAIVEKEGNKAMIIEDLCVGCGVCSDICPVKAIIPKS